MSLYRNSILQHPPVTFSEAGHIRRSSVHSIGRTSVFSGAGEGLIYSLQLLRAGDR